MPKSKYKNQYSNTDKQRVKHKGGFSIAELIIVIAIFSVITMVALFDQNRLSSNILITNLAYETALAVREAQVYGIGVKDFGDSGDTFSGRFGAHFDIAFPTSIVLFDDIALNYHYDEATEAKFQYTFTNQRGNKIVAMCVSNSQVSTYKCTPTLGDPVSNLDIIFVRPNPDANFYTYESGTSVQKFGRAYIVVNNIDDDNCHTIIIEQTGQIRVENGKKVDAVCVNT